MFNRGLRARVSDEVRVTFSNAICHFTFFFLRWTNILAGWK